ncbi:MAG: hypothetical protein MH213_16730, partial [Marinobacter sp.]|nr:hypothetical protein [Marinobacter sp.]
LRIAGAAGRKKQNRINLSVGADIAASAWVFNLDNRRVMMFAHSQQAQSVDCPGLSELFTNRNRPQDLDN